MISLDEILIRMRRLTIAWTIICTGLLGGIIILTLDNIALREELAKPLPPLTMQQRHQVIKEYHANMQAETKWALRKIIGCKE